MSFKANVERARRALDRDSIVEAIAYLQTALAERDHAEHPERDAEIDAALRAALCSELPWHDLHDDPEGSPCNCAPCPGCGKPPPYVAAETVLVPVINPKLPRTAIGTVAADSRFRVAQCMVDDHGLCAICGAALGGYLERVEHFDVQHDLIYVR